MINTIRGYDGKPYISLEDLIVEVDTSSKMLKENLEDMEDYNPDRTKLEDRLEVMVSLSKTFKEIQQDYYKRLLGMEE